MHLSLYQTQDDDDTPKEGLIDEIEARLEQPLTRDVLFAIRGKMV